ncbi:MAG: hypothetical protein HY657_19955 [Acidobacteria bacterium]|nr:hypothetical protein [Acidobacteriota bacterium]
MTRTALLVVSAAAALASPPFALTAGTQRSERALPMPAAISGPATSARHCVSGDSANVHGLGWLEAGSRFSVTFEADFKPATSLAKLDLDGERATINYGDPDIRFTSTVPGTMALYVRAVAEAGCYRYKVEVEPPAGLAAPAVAGGSAVKPRKSGIHAMAIAGGASSAKHCVAGLWVATVHEIGRIEQGSQVRITFESDFDPVAGVTLVNAETRRGTFRIDDDSGGNLEPLLSFTASQSGTLALSVSGFSGRAGCYQYQVEIR